MYHERKGNSMTQEEEMRSEEHTSELQSQSNLGCRLLLAKKKTQRQARRTGADTGASPALGPALDRGGAAMNRWGAISVAMMDYLAAHDFAGVLPLCGEQRALDFFPTRRSSD